MSTVDEPAMIEVPSMATASLTDGFWGDMAALHRGPALEHQAEQLTSTGAIECFEATAGRADAFVVKDFTSDSDVHKWLEAVARTPVPQRSPQVSQRFDEVVALVEATQAADGYCHTWIQGLFPDGRFRNLETEHEHYTMGHLIEAGVSAWEATGDDRLLTIARRSADLLVRELADAPATAAVGHEELEIALVRLARATGEDAYRRVALRLVTVRGTGSWVRARFVRCVTSTARRLIAHRRRLRAHRTAHPAWRPPSRPAGLQVTVTPTVVWRTAAAFVSGRWGQTDRPVIELTTPTGHAVCFQYLQTAMAMLARDLGDEALRDVTEAAWEELVLGHLFVNGGTGALAGVEGFGEAYDLDPERAYSETCASLAGVFWNRELGLLTGEARHDDLLEWQLLNGVAVGTSADGTAYHYNNPLQVGPGFERRPWYPIPCCPSNLSRTWASLATLQWSRRGDELRLHQFFSSEVELGGTELRVTSDLPWSGGVTVEVGADRTGPDGSRRLAFRVPGWAGAVSAHVDGVAVVPEVEPAEAPRATASGLDPWQARWAHLALPDALPCTIRLEFELPIRLLRQDPRVTRAGGAVALARGPLLFCLDGVDHPSLRGDALHDLELDRSSPVAVFDPELLGGAVEVRATTADGRPLRFIPYYLWGNRGADGMTVFVR